jgi:hypothetical protein
MRKIFRPKRWKNVSLSTECGKLLSGPFFLRARSYKSENIKKAVEKLFHIAKAISTNILIAFFKCN